MPRRAWPGSWTQVERTGRVEFVSGTVASLRRNNTTVSGVTLSDGRVLSADLVVLATGAWTGSLLDLSGRATATGQVLGYIDLTDTEQEQLKDMPVCLNLTTGLFVIPPRDRVLKAARHAYGYLNPTEPANDPLPASPSNANVSPTMSLPRTHLDDPSISAPAEGLADLRRAIRDMVSLPPSSSGHSLAHGCAGIPTRRRETSSSHITRHGRVCSSRPVAADMDSNSYRLSVTRLRIASCGSVHTNLRRNGHGRTPPKMRSLLRMAAEEGNPASS